MTFPNRSLADSPPEPAAWGDLSVDVEVQAGFERFSGLSVGEAVPLVLRHPIEATAELRRVPAEVFRYYIWAVVAALEPPKAAGQSDLASCFLRLLVWRRRQLPEGLETLWPDIADIAREVAREQDYYDAPVDIYGSFQDLVDRFEQ